MFLLDGTVVYGASDLAAVATCEYAALRTLDAVLGRGPRPPGGADEMLARTVELGNAHEVHLLTTLRERFGEYQPATGRGVLEMPVKGRLDAPTLAKRHNQTIDALRAGTDAVYQGTFFDGRFHGRADFLLHTDSGYLVTDTKLARHATITALLQVAAYADQLVAAGIDVADRVELMLGDGSTAAQPLGDLLPVYRERRARLQDLFDTHAASGAPAAWGVPPACGRCEVCKPEIAERRDLLMVAGMRSTTRAKFVEAGVQSIDQLAVADLSAETSIPSRTIAKLQAQARLQVRQTPPTGETGPVEFEIIDTAPIAALPVPDAGDIFFDFEGDPLWAETGSTVWGLEYLFGVIEQPVGDAEPVFRSFFAHDRAQEKRALLEFLDYVAQRRRQYPGMHIYHYAAYERSTLLRLAGRHGAGEEAVDQLLRDGVLVDLYATVRGTVRISQDSYSIKKLEPLYMGDRLRDGEVTTAADSILQYHRFCLARDDGRTGEAQQILGEITDYNEYDCLSTLRLRDWLLARGAEREVYPSRFSAEQPTAAPNEKKAAQDAETLQVMEALLGWVGEAPASARTADQQAVALVAASLGYHQREAKPFWWEHFDRLRGPLDEWSDRMDALVVRTAEVVEPWSKPPGTRTFRRQLLLTGRLAAGSAFKPGSEGYTLHDPPVPNGLPVKDGCDRSTCTAKVWELTRDPVSGDDVLRVEERAPTGCDPFDALPTALAAGNPPSTDGLQRAVLALATQVRDACSGAAQGFPEQAGLDLVRRLPPRLVGGAALPPVGDGADRYITAITEAVSRLDHSYLAVQGPPGTGKTYVGARVIARLVEQGWRIGVVAQSHAVVENLLRGVVDAGVDATQVGKEPEKADTCTWNPVSRKDYASFLASHAETGCVLGGTAWDFVNGGRVSPGSLDLLVVDEAGQFSLANTLAVTIAAQRLLLLGDPQQLPQVSKGTHPEPVDGSALGWLADGHAALPEDRGYFLQRTWRMHPALCQPVSHLSYDDRLFSEEARTAARSLDGIAPGVLVVPVVHRENSVESPQEAAEVVAQVRGLLGRTWQDENGSRPLEQSDILVVAPFNAQVDLIREVLGLAGHPDVLVGTVDKFQGKEAPVVIMSMTASEAAEVPRGMGFLLSRNRLNVAISRGKWCAILLRSPALTDFLPSNPQGLAELGAFIGLCSAATESSALDSESRGEPVASGAWST